MADKRTKPGETKQEIVITPGGPRPRDRVHEVAQYEAVKGDGGGRVVMRRDGVGSVTQRGNVRGDFVVTPGGYRPRSYVHEVPSGHAVTGAAGHGRLVNLKTKAMIEVVDMTEPPVALPPLGNGWITYAYWNNGTGKSITSFRTTWKVPPPPTSQSGQLVYLFNGIENYGANYGILQPVLQWGNSPAGGGAQWEVASWYVTADQHAYRSQLMPVNEGDVLVGVMTLTGQSGNLFDYTSEFEGIAGTSLQVQSIAELLWCSQTLEAYDINSCSDYPNTTRTPFRAIEIQTGATTPAVMWTPTNSVIDCGQHTIVVSHSATNGEVDVYYRDQPSRFRLDDYLIIRDPALLWFYRHGGEDPEWGKRPVGQVAISTMIHELAGQLTDRALRKSLQRLAGKAVMQAAKGLERA